MTAQAPPTWLAPAYAAALVLHGMIVVGLVGLAVMLAARIGTGANAARESLGMGLALFLTGLLPAVPSGVALMSWHLCRRRGWTPSSGHMGLTIVAALAISVVLLLVVLS